MYRLPDPIAQFQTQVDRTIPIEDTWNELKKLKEEGKVKNLGISEATVEEIRRAHAITPISALQIEASKFPILTAAGIDLHSLVLSLDP